MTPIAEAAVLDALRAVKDPDLHKDIVALGFVKNLRIAGGAVAFTIELTTPACPVKDLLREQARTRGVCAAGRDGSRDRDDGAGARGGPAGARTAAGRRRQEHHRGRRRQGRGGQDHACRESGRGAGAAWQPRRAARRRHVRAERADHARPEDPARDRRQEDRARRTLRPAGRLDGIPDAGRCAGHLARADAARRDPAVFPRRRLEQRRLSHRGHAAGHGRRGAQSQSVRAGGRRRAGDDAADRLAGRHAPRGGDVPQAQHSGDWPDREHEPLRLSRAAGAKATSSARAAAKRSRRR